jgi:mRNA interferase MazF
LNRGDIWIASGGPSYAGKPRPVVVVQSHRFDATLSMTICGFTTTPLERPWARLHVSPTAENGLMQSSWLMVDKLMTLSRRNFDRRIGRLSKEDMQRLNEAIMVVLGVTGRNRIGA